MQEHIRQLYLKRDQDRPLVQNVLKFVEEIGELAEALLANERAKLEEEFADVLAWLLSLANLYNINVESAFYSKYPREGCLKCGKLPCLCTDF